MAATRFCLLLALVATACWAQKKCCFPAQFEVATGVWTASASNGESHVEFDEYQTAYDHTNKRMARITYKRDLGALTKFQDIYDYNKEIEYMIQVKPIVSVCSTRKLDPKTSLTNCVPSNAAFLGEHYFGDKKFYVDSFNYQYQRNNISGSLTLSVSKKGCIPTSVVLIGTNYNVPTMYVTGVSNYTEGISNPDKYFKVPDVCRPIETKQKDLNQASPFDFF